MMDLALATLLSTTTLFAGGTFSALLFRSKIARANAQLLEATKMAQGDTMVPGIASTLENLHEGVYRSSLDGKMIYANKALVKITGYDSFNDMIAQAGDKASEWYADPKRRDAFAEVLNREGVVKNFVSQIYRHKTRELIWIAENAHLVRDPKSGEPLYFTGTIQEITDRVEKHQQADLFEKLAESLPGGLFRLERAPDGTLSAPYTSRGFREIMGLDRAAAADAESWKSRLHRDDVATFYATLHQSAGSLEPWHVEFRLRFGAAERWVEMSATPEITNGRTVWHGYLISVADRKKQEREIHNLAFYDPLTGLQNRRKFRECLDHALVHHTDTECVGAVFFIDLDNFKALNDSFGHDHGDMLLRKIAKRIRYVLPHNSIIARFGGDEFVAIAPEIGETSATAREVAKQLAIELCNTIARPTHISSAMHCSTCSIGVTIFTGESEEANALLALADAAMYEAKRNGRNTFFLADDTTEKNRLRSYSLLQDIQTALQDDQFVLHIQPQVDRNGRIIGGEALARWQHPIHGMVSPGEFIPILENSGHIIEFSFWSLATALGMLREWAGDPKLADVQLSVNLSPQCISQPSVWSQIETMLRDSGDTARRLTIEITESSAAKNLGIVRQRIATMRALGVRFSIDDFGTGFSALAYLRDLSCDELKIDNAFVGHIHTEDVDQKLVGMIIDAAHAMGMQVVAEFVEEQEQEDALIKLGCDVLQGYRYAPALAKDQFETMARRMRHPCSESVKSRQAG